MRPFYSVFLMLKRTCYQLQCHTLSIPPEECIHGCNINTSVIGEHTENVYNVYQIDRAVIRRNLYSNFTEMQFCWKH